MPILRYYVIPIMYLVQLAHIFRITVWSGNNKREFKKKVVNKEVHLSKRCGPWVSFLYHGKRVVTALVTFDAINM
jgi:hypothetical protein